MIVFDFRSRRTKEHHNPLQEVRASHTQTVPVNIVQLLGASIDESCYKWALIDSFQRFWLFFFLHLLRSWLSLNFNCCVRLLCACKRATHNEQLMIIFAGQPLFFYLLRPQTMYNFIVYYDSWCLRQIVWVEMEEKLDACFFVGNEWNEWKYIMTVGDKRAGRWWMMNFEVAVLTVEAGGETL